MNDKHEDEDNVRDRNNSIDTYLEVELDCHHWVEVPEHAILELEDDHEIIDAYHPFTKCGELYREYHVDAHPCLLKILKNNYFLTFVYNTLGPLDALQ